MRIPSSLYYLRRRRPAQGAGAELHNAQPLSHESEVTENSEESPPKYKKISRKNTAEEKRRMRSSRKKRKRSMRKAQVATLKKKVEDVHKLREESEKRVNVYRRMARSFWERWQWELRQRKEAMIREKSAMMVSQHGKSSSPRVFQLHEVDHSLLHDPVVKGSSVEIFLGRGSFGIVKLQTFRGIKVAVKELLPRTLLSDVRCEACILAKLSHPFVPYLFGVCTTVQPYRIVMQLHGIADNAVSLTLYEAITTKKTELEGYTWLGLCAQIMEALHYLHEEVCILHNDITASNIAVTDSMTEGQESFLQIVLIDFGKATTIDDGRKYNLSDVEKAEYTIRYPQMAPEVIDGITRQTKWSDMYAAGGVIQRIVDNQCFNQLPAEYKSTLNSACSH